MKVIIKLWSLISLLCPAITMHAENFVKLLLLCVANVSLTLEHSPVQLLLRKVIFSHLMVDV